MDIARTCRTGFLFSLLLLLLPVGTSFAGEEVVKDGVLHVVNEAEPRDGRQEVQLEEVWRVGGDDSEDFFGMISQVKVDDDGTVYLLDTRLAEIPVYSPEGERLRTLSREGEGPGETRMPSNLIFMPGGNLGIVQIFPGKITIIDKQGAPVGEFKVGGGDPTKGGLMQFFDCQSVGDRLIVCGESIAMGDGNQTRTNFVASYDLEGQEISRFFENPVFQDYSQWIFNEDEQVRVAFRQVLAGPDGRVYLIPSRNRYAINVYSQDGALERIIERENFEHRVRSDEDYELIKSTVQAQLAQLPNPKITISRTEPDLTSLTMGSDGNIWVSTSKSGVDQPKGVFFTWDIFDLDGHFIKQISAACPGDGEEDMLVWTPGGDAVQVTGFLAAARALGGGVGSGEEDEEAVPMEIIYYRAIGD